MLELREIAYRYGETMAVEDVSLVCGRGRTTVLIGPSGCGKSTLLRLIVGLLAPDTGSVLHDGAAVEREALQVFRHRLGYVIQEGGLFPHLTARQNVTLVAAYLGWAADRIEARVRELAELTRLEATLLERHPQQLSGGQRQRVSLMRALMLDPELLLLDEPLGALDPLIRFDLQSDLREIFRALGKTVVLVTHDLGEAAYLGDEIVLLWEGRVLQRGTLHDLVENPADERVTRFVRAQRSHLGEAP